MGKHVPGIGLNQVYETNTVPQLGDIRDAMRALATEPAEAVTAEAMTQRTNDNTASSSTPLCH